ncbi:MAG: hypothetical protein IJQ93_14240 [Bacteroidales bacterium]|nr:hypothetical protein [Bacteroidales bacterium]MBR0301458.1 hypothetical protein [Bacteroidales bacterium]
MIIGLIISITLAVTFLFLYVANVQDYASMKKDNEWQKQQLDGFKRDNELLQKRLEEAQASAQSKPQPSAAPVTSSDYDSRPLNKETAMEAIRYNGYVPDFDGHWINFMVQGEHFSIDAERFPIMLMIKFYSMDRADFDMDIMHKAAHQVSDELCMGKVLFTGDDGIAFQFATIDNKFGQFRDNLARYISIIGEAQNRMGQLYNEMTEASAVGEKANGDSQFKLPSYAKGWDA